MNRQITGRIATFHFAPTDLNRQNLLNENVDENKIVVTGNTVIDALHTVVEKLKRNKYLAEEQQKILADAGYETRCKRVSESPRNETDGTEDHPVSRRLVLITGHRRENFGEGFINMLTAMKDLSRMYPNVDFVYPMHLNPNVRRPIHEVFGEDLSVYPNFYFIEPLQYITFVYLMEKSYLVLTDSGGIQEEAPGLGKPVLVMRNTTERPEALAAGTVKLVGTNYNLIVSEVSRLIEDVDYYNKISKVSNPYGDGNASQRIADKLVESL
jgi:UDP-N-acetylglucosamine 2-epimerase (non-hydrolysing)